MNKDLDIADASDSDAFDPDNYKDDDEEEDEEEGLRSKDKKGKKYVEAENEDDYDIDNMDYEGDPEDLPDFDLIDDNDGGED